MGEAPAIPGFRLGAELHRDRGAVVVEALQEGLDRPAVVELVAHDPADPATAPQAVQEAARRQSLLRHPAIATVYAAGPCDGGAYVARRCLDRADRLDAGPETPDRLRRLAEALELAHGAGLVHGAVHELGRRDEGCLTRLVLAGDEHTPQADLEGLTALRAAPVRRPRRGRAATMAAAGLLGGAALALVLVAGGNDAGPARSPDALPAPAPAVGSTAVGADLAPQPTRAVDCDGRRPGPNSPACSIVPVRATGGPTAVAADGVVRRWAVRGARGVLALQAVRRGADGRWRETARTQYVRVPGPGPHAFAADLLVRRGDRLGLELTPGAAVGVAARGRARALRFEGPLEVIRAPRAATRELPVQGAEVLVRADVVPGAARRSVPGRLTGAGAGRAPAGRELDATEIEQADGRIARVALVRVGGAIAVDLFDGGRRTVRLPLADLQAGGRLFDGLETGFVGASLVRIRWRNPGSGPVVVHDVVVRSGTLRLTT